MNTNKTIEITNLMKSGATIHQAIEQTIGWHPLQNKKCPITDEEYKLLVQEALKFNNYN